jgi:asparagine synthase (glutamine-hydrolysing)
LNALVQDTLRGQAFAAMPFFDQKQVIGLLDALPGTDQGRRVASDQLLMMLTSAAVLNDRYRLTA